MDGGRPRMVAHLRDAAPTPRWLGLAWRLPSGSSTPRVTLWRSLKRLGAATLTPGAVLLPYSEEIQEQLDWLAQDIEEQGGDAWVLPITALTAAEEAKVAKQINEERREEYLRLRAAAEAFLAGSATRPGSGDDHQPRIRIERELLALQRRFRKIRGRDYFGAPGRRQAALAIDQCLVFRQGISPGITRKTDMPVGPAR